MKKSVQIAAVVATVPLMGASAIGVAAAAADPSEVVIDQLDGLYLGQLSSAGKVPKITISASQVSLAFIDMTSATTARKVAKKTDGKATEKGTVVKTQGFRCKATSYKLVNPGTAGEYAKVNWKCTFQAADTPSTITLTYKQSSL